MPWILLGKTKQVIIMYVGNLIRQSFVVLQPIIPTKMDLYLRDLCGVAKIT